jgi:phosphoglycerate kinase
MQKKRMVMFAKELALGDIYVNDAFGTAHRAHIDNNYCSIFQTKNVLELYLKEIESLNKVLKTVKNRLRLFLEGLKCHQNHSYRDILDKVDHMIIGGGMTFTFVKP